MKENFTIEEVAALIRLASSNGGKNKTAKKATPKKRKSTRTVNADPNAPVYFAEYISLADRENPKAEAKSIVAYGDGTKNHIATLKNMGARFNRGLDINESKQAGWIVSKRSCPTIDELKNRLGVK